MNQWRQSLAASVAGALVIGSAAHAAPIDTLTLTPSGTGTIFQISGTFSGETPTTSFSSPNTPYVLTFTVPTTPSDFAFVDSDNGVFGIETEATLNTTTFANSQVIFFPPAGPGGSGLLLCVGSGCQPDPNTVPYPSANFWDISTSVAVFSGIAPNVTFISGPVNVSTPPSSYVIATPVPEPGSLALAGLGMAAVALYRRRQLQREGASGSNA